MVPAMTPRWTALDASGPGTGTVSALRCWSKQPRLLSQFETDILHTGGGWADGHAEARRGAENMRR